MSQIITKGLLSAKLIMKGFFGLEAPPSQEILIAFGARSKTLIDQASRAKTLTSGNFRAKTFVAGGRRR